MRAYAIPLTTVAVHDVRWTQSDRGTAQHHVQITVRCMQACLKVEVPDAAKLWGDLSALLSGLVVADVVEQLETSLHPALARLGVMRASKQHAYMQRLGGGEVQHIETARLLVQIVYSPRHVQ